MIFFYYMARFSWLYSTLNLAIQHNKFGYIAVGSLAIQPDISGYIARYTWLYSSWLYSQASYSNLRYIASYLWLYSYWLYSQIYLAIQLAGYIARYIWLYSQIYLAIQLLAIQPDISGYIANSYIARDNWLYISNLNSLPGQIAKSYIARYIWLCSQTYLAIQPDISGYIASELYSQLYLAIQPGKSGYIARYKWLYSQL